MCVCKHDYYYNNDTFKCEYKENTIKCKVEYCGTCLHD